VFPTPPLKRPEWVLAAVAIAVIAVVAWESWERNKGDDRAVLNGAFGILLWFLARMSVVRGIGHFRSCPSNYRWIFEVLMGLASLVVSILFIKRLRTRDSANVAVMIPPLSTGPNSS
jgi:hypothetical protein